MIGRDGIQDGDAAYSASHAYIHPSPRRKIPQGNRDVVPWVNDQDGGPPSFPHKKGPRV